MGTPKGKPKGRKEGMRHSKTATFSTSKIRKVCQEQGVDFGQFAKACERLEGRKGTYNSWLDLTRDVSVYDFKLDDGSVEQVPAQLVIED